MKVDDEQAHWDVARSGDGEAFAQIFDLHRNRVFRHALRLVDSVSDAEDAVAIAFMELWRRRDTVRLVNGSVLPWLLVTATHITRNIQRSSRRYRALLLRLPRTEVTTDVAQEFLLTSVEGLDPRLVSELRFLGRVDQQLLSLVALEGYSMAETAELLELSLPAAKSRLRRIRQRLQPKLQTHAREATT